MKKVLVIGGSGRLGSSIVECLRFHQIPVLATYCEHPHHACGQRFDLFKDSKKALIAKAKDVDTVIFAAHVERQPREYVVKHMKRLCDNVDALRFVYISSDAVFDGGNGRYKETDRPFPMTQYGRNLRECEKIALDMLNSMVVRPSYLYGFYDRGERLDPRLAGCRDTIRKGLPWPAFEDMFKSPIVFQQAALATVALAGSEEQGIVHLGGPRTSIFEFFYHGMRALGERSDLVTPTSMNSSTKVDLLPDTSLQFAKMEELTGITPMSVYEALMRSRHATVVA